MVVDGDDRVGARFSHCPDRVVDPFLHLGIGALNGIQFDSVAVFTGSH